MLLPRAGGRHERPPGTTHPRRARRAGRAAARLFHQQQCLRAVPSALAAVRQADATRYPDAGYTALRGNSRPFTAWTKRVCCWPPAPVNSSFASRRWRRAGRTRRVAAAISYGDYAQAAVAHGLTVASTGRAMRNCSGPASLPARWGAAQQGLSALVDGRGAQTLVVLDRAYEPLRLSAAPTLSPQQLQNTWQLWTPNKALGLTGVRAAYAIAPVGQEDAAAALEQLCPSWPVGAHGEAMLQAWTGREAQDWLAASLETLREWKARQIAVCESLGWRCLPSEANFFCAQPALPEGLSLQAGPGRAARPGHQAARHHFLRPARPCAPGRAAACRAGCAAQCMATTF
jgi:histidinol-phosphate aminotransferase